MRVLSCLLAFVVPTSSAIAASYSEAKSAYDRNQVAEAERLYAEVVVDKTATAADRSAAERELARIAWLIDGEPKRALEHLASARAIGDKPCDTSAMIARVLRESRQDAEAIRSSDALLSSCPEADKRDEIRTHLVGARLDRAFAIPADRQELLAAAVAEGKKFTPDAGLEAARVRLEVALLTSDAPAAMAAWKDYFWLDDSDAPQAHESIGATALFNKGLGIDASLDDRLKLAELLMRTGFTVQSRRFAEAHRLPAQAPGHPILKKLQAYWSVRDKLEAFFLQLNRRFARGGKTAAVLKAGRTDLDRVDAAWRAELLAAADSKGAPDAVLAKSYGIFGTAVGETSGYPSLHRGHIVEDREMVISQYGKTARIHYMSIDNMLANGFESWLWDGGPMVGGWQADGIIVNVRPGYVQSPLRAYAQSQDSVARRDLIGRQQQRGAEDLAKLKARPISTLNGLNDRLQLQLIDRIMASARSKATDEAGVRATFLGEFGHANFDQSMVKHEGRHAIDESLGLSDKVEQPVLEYQAKLSELALSTYPRMALRNMNLNLEGEGPHDKAGARVFDEYRRWMEAHTDQILGYDPAIPVLAQFDKLSDSQIREIARELDPLANGRPSPAKL